jgi:putative transposase
MSSHVYHEIYLHLNWHTKLDQPVLTGHLEELTHGLIRQKCREVKGVYLHGIGGTDDHVHIAVNVEPFVSISTFLQEVKGASAHQANERIGRKALEWQRGYGVVSFGKAHLPWVLGYIDKQREHHAQKTTIDRLEEHEIPANTSGDSE